MPATLPPQLHARLDDLAGRVRKLRTVRAMSRAALLIPAAAFVCVAADASFGLAAWARGLMFGGWLLLVAREVWNIRRARTATVDLEALASAVEAEFPRLAERLTTAVELAGRSDVSNGAPALIEEVIRDADTRARKLDLDSAFPAAATLGGFAVVLTMAVALAVPVAFSPRGGEYARRFFAPWSSLAPAAHYRVIVTSGDPAVKRGSQVSLVAYVEPTKADAPLPELATLVVIAHGREERLEMMAGDDNFWHVRRPAEGDFDYRVEAGAATSDTHHVIAVEPVALSSARVTVQPPAYAVAASGPGVAVEGLGELAALEHSTVNFDLHFRPTPTSAILEFLPEGNGDDKPKKERHDLKVAADGAATISVPATSSGTFTLVAVGDRGVRTDFPSQPLRVHRDEPPKFPRVGGLGDKPRDVRPGEKIIIEWAAIDDVAVAKLEFEWRVNDGPARRTPLDARGLGTPQAEGKYAFALKDRVKDGDALACRLIATDNRDVPAAKLGPQMTYFPGAEAWAEFKISAAAEPLAEQDILRRKREIETKLQEIQREVKAEARAADKATAESREKKFPTPDQQEAMKTLLAEAKESAAKLDDLARDVAVTPDLGRLAEALRRVADREMKDAESALSRAADPAAASDRTKQWQKAGESLAAAVKRMDELLEQNEKAAKERLDKRALEDLAQDQHDLAETAKAADPKEAADLAQKQKELEERLKKLRAGSDAAKLATDAAKASEAEKWAAEARRAAADMRAFNEATKRDDKNDLSARLADLKKKQDALAKKARDLAAKTDTPSRAADTPPLKSDDAAKATDALENGDLDEAAKQQEKVRQDLERLANALEAASADSRDARGTARQLARLQEDLRQRLAQET